MGMSGAYGPAERDEAIATIHAVRRGPRQDIVPLIVAKTRTRLREVLGVLDATLSAQDLGDRGGGAV